MTNLEKNIDLPKGIETDAGIQQSTIQEINSLHSELEALVKTSLGKAIRIGELLTDCKDQLKHGEFSAWVEENCTFKMRTAQRYMKVHEHRAQITGSDSLSDAYKLLQQSEKSDTVSLLDLDNLANSGDLTLSGLLTTPIIMSKKEIIVQEWIDKNPGQYDEIDRKMLSRILPILKIFVKEYGPIAILHMEELASMIKSKDL